MIDRACLRAAYIKARDTLLAERTPEGFWVGELPDEGDLHPLDVNEPVNVSCSFVATDSQHGREISLSQITVSPPMGWTVTAAGSSTPQCAVMG